MVSVEIEKCSIPIIWLDTSVIIRMALWKAGEAMDQIQSERTEFLYNQILALSRQKKLMCPQADQDEEIWRGRFECLEIMAFLSQGVKARYSEAIQDLQTRQLMHAYLQSLNEVEISYRDFFLDDPFHQQETHSDYIISVDFGLREAGNEIKNRKQRLAEKLENKRQTFVSKGVTYEEQLQKEYNAEWQELGRMFDRMLQGNLSPLDTWGVLDIVSSYIRWWEELGGQRSEIKDFFTSDHYKAIPTHNISSKIAARLITGNEPIKSGHTMDLRHASSAIPYADMFITDRYMKHIINELGIDTEYHTTICHVGDTEQLGSFFSAISA